MSKVLRIGTRKSPLAIWQAKTVEKKLQSYGYQTEIIPITSTGDIELTKPLYELGITGIFTKTLDIAMINGQVDIAVHSLKDVPTLLPKGIIQTAVFERASYQDILVTKGAPLFEKECTIATGSLRRKAQWLNRYPHHKVVGLRGNVNTRLQSLADSDWQGAIFAKAGLERIDLLPENYITLDWMIPAPSQGAMVVVAMEDDSYSINATTKLNHKPSEICTHIEREFLRVLEGGCTAPIGAHAITLNDKILLRGALLSLDGSKKIEIENTISINNFEGFGKYCAEEILKKGGKELMKNIKNSLQK